MEKGMLPNNFECGAKHWYAKLENPQKITPMKLKYIVMSAADSLSVCCSSWTRDWFAERNLLMRTNMVRVAKEETVVKFWKNAMRFWRYSMSGKLSNDSP